jgi:predicted ribosome quality control (RQC) complex YloA/Tae2 family protein
LPEIQAIILGQRLEQIYCHESGLSLAIAGRYLRWQICSGHVRLGFYPERLPSQVPSAFIMLLRKYLKNARLVSVEALSGDRIWHFHWHISDLSFTLVFELTGRHANLFLLNQQHLILGAFRRDRSQLRDLSLGKPYQSPPLFNWTPSKNSHADKTLLALAGLPADGSRSHLLWQIWQQTDLFNQAQIRQENLAKRLQLSQKSLIGQIQFWENSLNQAQSWPQWQRKGELLQGAWGQAEPGLSFIRVKDYFQADMPEVEITLDAGLSFQANLSNCFKQAEKFKKASKYAELKLLKLWEKQSQIEAWSRIWIEQTDLRQNYFSRGAWSELDKYLTFSEAEALKAGVQALQPKLTPKALLQHASQPWREYFSKLGQKIRVGKGAQANEKILKLAKGHDLWLHSRDWPGAYIWVPLTKNQILEAECLIDAASLALHFSQNPTESTAEIIYTFFKHLHKNKHAKLGEVSLRTFKSIIIRSDKDRIQRLLASCSP